MSSTSVFHRELVNQSNCIKKVIYEEGWIY